MPEVLGGNHPEYRRGYIRGYFEGAKFSVRLAEKRGALAAAEQTEESNASLDHNETRSPDG